MSDGTDKDNAYLNRLLQRAQELSSNPEAHDLADRIASRSEELFQPDDATRTKVRSVPPAAIEADAGPTPRRGLRM